LTIRGINGESEVIEQSAPSNNLHEKDMWEYFLKKLQKY
jgi:hypothetical protein